MSNKTQFISLIREAVLLESLDAQYDAVSEEIVPQNPLPFNV